MNPESSPFTPGQPVPFEYFVGRLAEIEHLRALVRASVNGRSKIGFVSGERGIGKTSLVAFVRRLCEREEEEQVAGAHVHLGGIKDVPSMIGRALDRLLQENLEKPWYGKLKDIFGNHIKKVGLFGISVELRLGPEDLSSLARGFVPALRQLIDKLKDKRKALLLILDDINGLAKSEEFANWLKSTVDEIATAPKGLNLCLLIVGLEERRRELLKLQPSLDRVFDLTEIRPWSDDETSHFFTNTLQRAGSSAEPEALELMVEYTGGFPVIGHEIGDAVWRVAEQARITETDVWAGIHQAAEIIGQKFLQPNVIEALRSPRHRSILRKIADNPIGLHFQRAAVLRGLVGDDKKALDNFLNRLKALGVIVPDGESGRGHYRFANPLHHLYFQLESRKAGGGPKRGDGTARGA